MVAHKKVYREFTGLRLTQSIPAHEGVIWKVAFNDTGAWMACGGAEAVVRIWSVVRAPVDQSALFARHVFFVGGVVPSTRVSAQPPTCLELHE